MDLRERAISSDDLAVVRELIRRRKVSYQPFVFASDLEVGEGLAFETNTSEVWPPRKGVVHWPGAPPSLAPITISAGDVDAFRAANARLRSWYEDNVRLIAGLVGTSGRDFVELGCNTGYVVHRLSMLGARRAIGVDTSDFSDVFRWFNRILGCSSEFIHGSWDSTRHSISSLPEVDVAISVSVTCHVADPLHMLAYLCAVSREAVFFMVPLSGKDDVSLTFGHAPNYFRRDLLWPDSFDSRVFPSAALVELGLRQCGFADIARPKDNVFVARRTGPGASIFAPPADPRERSNGNGAPTLVEQGFLGGFNIIACNGRFYGLAQDEGAFDEDKALGREYRRCVDADSLEDIKTRIRARWA
jgi:SAM-dependent methyltransferase